MIGMSIASVSGRNRSQRQADLMARGIPPIGSFSPDGWRRKIAELGGTAPRRAVKSELYAIYRRLMNPNT